MIFDKLTKLAQMQNDKTDTLIAKKIIQMYLNSNFLSIKEMANSIHVSESLITVFSKKLELKGYRELISLLKFERKDQLNTKVCIAEKENNINFNELYAEDILDITKLIKNKRVFIISSNQLQFQSEMLAEVFNLNHIDTKIFLNHYLFYSYLEKVKQDDVFMLFFAGQGNEVIWKIYEKITNFTKNIFVFSSNSQKYKFNEYVKKINVDVPFLPNNYIYRNISMSYIIALFLESINLLENN